MGDRLKGDLSLEELVNSVHGNLLSLADFIPEAQFALKMVENGFESHLRLRLAFYELLQGLQELLKTLEAWMHADRQNDVRTKIDMIRDMKTQIQGVLDAAISKNAKPGTEEGGSGDHG